MPDEIGFQWWEALVAGAAGTVLMTMMMRTAKAMGMTRMDMPLVMGSMFRSREGDARPLGMMLHFVNGIVVFGLIYSAIWWAIGIGDENVATAAWIGAIFGAVHGAIVATMMPMMSTMHPRVHEGATAGAGPGGEVTLPRFGFGGKGFGSPTPMGMTVGHVLYGATWAVVFVLLL